MLYPTELRTDIKKAHRVSFLIDFWSEYKDSNLGPPGPKPGALTGLRYTPSYLINFTVKTLIHSQQHFRNPLVVVVQLLVSNGCYSVGGFHQVKQR